MERRTCGGVVGGSDDLIVVVDQKVGGPVRVDDGCDLDRLLMLGQLLERFKRRLIGGIERGAARQRMAMGSGRRRCVRAGSSGSPREGWRA